jgi:hypothetical protein
VDIPLSTVFCASNELPQDESLNALFDRLLVRLEVKDLQDSHSFITMLETRPDPNPATILRWEEVVFAQEEARTTNVPEHVIHALAEIRQLLHAENIYPTPRRFQQALSIVRAAAWLDGETDADTEHLMPLQHVLWDDPSQRNQVTDIIAKVASPLDAEALVLLDEILRLRRDCEELDQGVKDGRINKVEARNSTVRELDVTHRFVKAFKNLKARAKQRNRLSEPMARCHSELDWLHNFFREAMDTDNKSNAVKKADLNE